MEAGTANAIADQKQIAKWMVSASLSVQNTKLHMQHPITAFFYYESFVQTPWMHE